MDATLRVGARPQSRHVAARRHEDARAVAQWVGYLYPGIIESAILGVVIDFFHAPVPYRLWIHARRAVEDCDTVAHVLGMVEHRLLDGLYTFHIDPACLEEGIQVGETYHCCVFGDFKTVDAATLRSIANQYACADAIRGRKGRLAGDAKGICSRSWHAICRAAGHIALGNPYEL